MAKSIELQEDRITVTKLMTDESIIVYYKDITGTMELEDHYMGRSSLKHYYLVLDSNKIANAKIKLPLGGLLNRKEQREVIDMILLKNPNVKFDYKLNICGDWEKLGGIKH